MADAQPTPNIKTTRKYVRKNLQNQDKILEKKPKKQVKFSKAVELLEQKRPRIIVEKNKYGNYEHPATGFIFDQATEQIVGKHVGNGKIEQLSDEDKQVAKRKYNFVLHRV